MEDDVRSRLRVCLRSRRRKDLQEAKILTPRKATSPWTNPTVLSTCKVEGGSRTPNSGETSPAKPVFFFLPLSSSFGLLALESTHMMRSSVHERSLPSFCIFLTCLPLLVEKC